MSDNLRRLGRFSIHRHQIMDDRYLATAMLADCVVVRAEQMWATDAIEYVAIHDSFDVVPKGDEVPWYTAEMERTGDGAVSFVRWKRMG